MKGVRFAASDFTPVGVIGLASLFSALVLVHLGVVLWLAFTSGGPGDPSLSYTARNFLDVYSDARTWRVLVDTLWFSLATLVVALAIGIPAAWLVERTDFRGKTLLFTLMAIGLLIPGFAAAMGWLFMLHPRIGLVNQFFLQNFRVGPVFDISSLAGLGWVQGLNLAPLAFIMTAAVFRAMDPTLEEAAQMHGARPWTVFRRVTLPLATPGIAAASIYIFMTGFAAFDVPAIIGWSNRNFTFATYLYLLLNPSDALPRYGLAAALSAVAMILAAGMSFWYAGMNRRAQSFAVVTGKAYRPRLVALGWRSIVAWGLIALYFLLSKIMPITVLVWSSLLPFFQLPSERAFRVASLKHYYELPWDLMLRALGNTAVLAVATPTITLGIALAFSWVVLRSRLRYRGLFDTIAFLPHAVPSVVFGVGALLLALFVFQKAMPIYGTIWLLLMVFVIARISYATRMTNAGLIQIHPELEESAAVSGATTFTAFRRVSVPLMAATLLYAWLWIALLTFRELTLAVIMTTSTNVTFPVVVWTIWLGGGLAPASAVAVVMLALMTPLIALYWVFARRQGILAT
jgi:iron(III) transport system permease protein